MAQMSLNAEIMAFGYSGMPPSHKPDHAPAQVLSDAAEAGAQEHVFHQPVRSLLVRLLNRRA